MFWKDPNDNGMEEVTWSPQAGFGTPSQVPNVNNVASSPTAIVIPSMGAEAIFWKDSNGYLAETWWQGTWKSGPPAEYTQFGQLN